MPSSGLAVVLADVVDEPGDVLPAVVVDGPAVLVEEVDGIHQLAVDVELELVGRGVADAHGAAATVAVEVVQLDLGQLVAAVDAVHELQTLVGFSLAAARLDPAHERGGLVVVAEPVEARRAVNDASRIQV